MQLKYFVILSVLGVAAAFTIPSAENSEEQRESSGDLQSSFSSPISPDSEQSSNLARDKRGLLFKKKHSGSDTYVVNRRYEGSSGYDYRPNREVHHHHHYSQQPIVEQPYQPYPAPSNGYHHYHGASGYQHQGSYASGGGAYYSGGYGSNGYSRPNYGDGGYAHYNGAYSQQEHQAPIGASPLASGHNSVDRGQGAAAVNNIAIIHARAGSSHNLVESESRVLPQPLPVGVADALDSMMHH